jgi:hypothetical protein
LFLDTAQETIAVSTLIAASPARTGASLFTPTWNPIIQILR